MQAARAAAKVAAAAKLDALQGARRRDEEARTHAALAAAAVRVGTRVCTREAEWEATGRGQPGFVSSGVRRRMRKQR
jgi:hypothetical protein